MANRLRLTNILTAPGGAAWKPNTGSVQFSPADAAAARWAVPGYRPAWPIIGVPNALGTALQELSGGDLYVPGDEPGTTYAGPLMEVSYDLQTTAGTWHRGSFLWRAVSTGGGVIDLCTPSPEGVPPTVDRPGVPATALLNSDVDNIMPSMGTFGLVRDRANQDPSPVNLRALTVPAAPTPVGTRPATNATVLRGTDLEVGVRRNLMVYTEAPDSGLYSKQNVAVTPGEALTVNGIKLTRVAGNQFYSALYSNLEGNGQALFTAGRRYLLSYYALTFGAAEQFTWMRDSIGGANPSHGAKLFRAGQVRRVWQLAHATSAFAVDVGQTPGTALGAGTSAHPFWLMQGDTEGGVFNAYIGGFQIDEVPADYKDGIALIWDSTGAGASGKIDRSDVGARESSTYLGGLLNVPVFNRAVGGERTDQMDARWGADITPLAVHCRYVVIGGGINDISQGRALDDIKGSIQSMHAKALADGLIPVHVNVTPFASAAVTPAKETDRLALNAWLAATYPTIDVAGAVADPRRASVLRPDLTWYGDGTHYLQAAKRVAGEAMAAWGGWQFLTPSPYQPVLADTFAGGKGLRLTSPNGQVTKTLILANDGTVQLV